MFIKIRSMHEETKETEGFLNMNFVELFAWDEELQLTLIWIKGVAQNYRVKETPEEVMQLIKEVTKC